MGWSGGANQYRLRSQVRHFMPPVTVRRRAAEEGCRIAWALVPWNANPLTPDAIVTAREQSVSIADTALLQV